MEVHCLRRCTSFFCVAVSRLYGWCCLIRFRAPALSFILLSGRVVLPGCSVRMPETFSSFVRIARFHAEVASGDLRNLQPA